MTGDTRMLSNDASARREATCGGARGRLSTCCSVAGIGGTVICSIGMVVAAVGLFAAGGATGAKGADSSMSGMSGSGDSASGASHVPAWLDALVRFGPEILAFSVLVLALAVYLRRRSAAVPAILGGLVLYLGMYVQPILAVMYMAMVIGTSLLVLAFVLTWRPKLARWPMALLQ